MYPISMFWMDILGKSHAFEYQAISRTQPWLLKTLYIHKTEVDPPTPLRNNLLGFKPLVYHDRLPTIYHCIVIVQTCGCTAKVQLLCDMIRWLHCWSLFMVVCYITSFIIFNDQISIISLHLNYYQCKYINPCWLNQLHFQRKLIWYVYRQTQGWTDI